MDAALQKNLNEQAEAIGALLKKAALDFVNGHATDAVDLTADEIKAIFDEAKYAVIPIPPLSPDFTADELAARMEAERDRDMTAELVAAAQLKNNQIVSKLRSDAIAAVAKIGAAVAGVGLAVLKAGM